MKTYLVGIIVLLVILIVGYWNYTINTQGIWVGDDEFLKQAQLDELIFNWSESGSGTIFIKKGEEVIDIPTKLTSIPNPFHLIVPGYHKSLLWLDNDSDVWPSRVTAEINMRTGELLISKGDEVYAKLYKYFQ
jgi:hypothetical protein